MRTRTMWVTMALAGGLAACGGGGGGGGESTSGSGPAPTAAQLTVTAVSPAGRYAAGDVVTIDATITNVGGIAATPIDLRFYGFLPNTMTCDAAGGAMCPALPTFFSRTGDLHLYAPSLPAQGSWHFRIVQGVGSTTSPPSPRFISAHILGPGFTDPQANVTITTYNNQLLVTGGALTPTAVPGGNATYGMTVTNAGPDPAVDFLVTNDVGPQQTLLSMTCVAARGAVCPTTAATGTSTRVPLLPMNGSLAFTMTAAVATNASGTLSDVFNVADPGDRYPNDNLRIATTFAAPASNNVSYLTLRGDPGDVLGGGASYAYTPATANLQVLLSDNYLQINVNGNESWSGRIRPDSVLQPGTYATGFDWFGNNAMGCSNDRRALLVIDSMVLNAGALSAIDLHFDQACSATSPVQHGVLHWTAADTTRPPGPVNPPPPALWRAPAASTPSSGNYVFLSGGASDTAGVGRTVLLTQANAVFTLRTDAPYLLRLNMQADDDVRAEFQGNMTQAHFLPGYYGPTQSNPTIGRFSWYQGLDGCQAVTGWFVIDAVQYAGTDVQSFDARFEQNCGNTIPPLRGQVHWAVGDTTVAAGPVQPPPAGLWSPGAGITPATGNYVYMESDEFEVLLGGDAYLLTPANSLFAASSTANRVTFSAGSATRAAAFFGGDFLGMSSITQLRPGYYPATKRIVSSNPARGGMDVGVFEVVCNVSSGWFAVDAISYTGTTLTALDMRFEEHCEGETQSVRGKIHWVAG